MSNDPGKTDPGGASPGFSRRGDTSQMPERSGLPSGVLSQRLHELEQLTLGQVDQLGLGELPNHVQQSRSETQAEWIEQAM